MLEELIVPGDGRAGATGTAPCPGRGRISEPNIKYSHLYVAKFAACDNCDKPSWSTSTLRYELAMRSPNYLFRVVTLAAMVAIPITWKYGMNIIVHAMNARVDEINKCCHCTRPSLRGTFCKQPPRCTINPVQRRNKVYSVHAQVAGAAA